MVGLHTALAMATSVKTQAWIQQAAQLEDEGSESGLLGGHSVLSI